MEPHVPPAKLIRRVKTRGGYIQLTVFGRDRKVVVTSYKRGKQAKSTKRFGGRENEERGEEWTNHRRD